MKKTLLIAVLALVLLAPAATLAGPKDKDAPEAWIHVEVREAGGDKATVNVNVPFSLADAALESMGDDIGTHIRLGSHGRHGRAVEVDGEGVTSDSDHPELSIADLRRMWKAMRDAGEADYVTVTSNEENVHIWREGDLVRVDVDSRAEGKGEKVRIRVPVGVMDALLSGEGDQLDVRAAVNSLKGMKSGEVVRVEEEGGDQVRIWIDDSPEAGS